MGQKAQKLDIARDLAMKLSSDDFPSSLPPWLRDWAILNRDRPSTAQRDLCLVSQDDLPTLWRLLTSGEVAVRLHDLDSRRTSSPDLRHDITDLLGMVCTSFRQSKTQLKLSPGELNKQLSALAEKSKQLGLEIDRLTSLLQDAINSEYLKQRAFAEQPAGFSRRKRAGLRQGSFDYFHPEAPSLSDLLLAFSEDVVEEITRLKKHNQKSDGGDGAPIRFQIKRIKTLTTRMFGKAENALVAALLSAANGQHIDEERIKKTKVTKGKN